MSAPSSRLHRATQRATDAANSAEVTVRSVVELPELTAVVDLFDDIWSTGGAAPISLEHLRALAFAGSFVAGAYDGPELVGASVAFLCQPVGAALHSDITGVSRQTRIRGIGTALKLYQRAWALERGLNRIFWTFDPLVARNAHFNLTRLGAAVDAYLVDFYGDMADGINSGQGSDRLHMCWSILDEHAATEPLLDVAALLSEGPAGIAVTNSVPADAPRVSVAIPSDIERLRRESPDLARRWREAVRATLGAELGAGGRVVGFGSPHGYLVERGGSGSASRPNRSPPA